MKNYRLAAFMVAFFSLCVVNTRGAGPVQPPARLDIGSEAALKEGAVTKDQSIGTGIYFTNSSGIRWFTGSGFGGKFASFDAYRTYTISNAYWRFVQVKPEMDPNKTVMWDIYVGYANSGNTFNSLKCFTNIGIASLVTSNTFVNAFNPTNICAIVPVPGLQQFTVEVKGVYTNTWPAPVQDSQQLNVVSSQFPPERTTNNVVILNPWYSLGTNEARFTIIVVGGKTRKYTQFGDPLDKPPIVAITTDSVTATFARGAWVTLESSSNLINWSVVTNISDIGGLGFISIPYTKDQPRQFYRVGIQ